MTGLALVSARKLCSLFSDKAFGSRLSAAFVGMAIIS